jgi:hypothetical protein
LKGLKELRAARPLGSYCTVQRDPIADELS